MTKTNRGGARQGAGRKQLYSEPLVDAATFSMRVNEEQGAAIGAWCVKHKVAPATLIREVGLLRSGAVSLGLGLEKLKGTAEKPIGLDGPSVFPVKCTARQGKAIRTYCLKKKVAPQSWLREAVLEYIGKPELGLRGQASAMDRAL